MNLTQHELIDKYLRNELSSGELKAFEERLASEPGFKEQVDFDQTVKEGISQYRKAQLKARMDAIEVAPGWMGIGQLGQNAVIKGVGVIAAASVIGFSAYMMMDNPSDEVPNDHPVFIEDFNAAQTVEELVLEIPDLQKLAEEKKLVQSEKADLKDIGTKLTESQKAVAVADELTDEKEEDFVPVVNVPGFNDPDAEQSLTTTDADLPEMSNADELNTSSGSPMDVQTFNRSSEELKYKYFEGKLFLYGDFNNAPYEILEINRPKEKKIYLLHKDQYFEITPVDKVQVLEPLSNQKLIKELEIVRNNKL